MKTLNALVIFLVAAAGAKAQTVILKDGRQIIGTAMTRVGDQVSVTVPLGQGIEKRSNPVSTIERIVFPEPPELRKATELVGQGKSDQAIAAVDLALAAQAPFKDIAGNWWAHAAVLKLSALGNAGRDKEAEVLLNEVIKGAADKEMVRVAQVRFAGVLIKKEEFKKAIAMCEAVAKESQNPQVLSDAWLNLGAANLGLKQFEQALRAYLRVPIFYAENKPLLAPAQLGIARSYIGFQDFDRGIAAYEELLTNHKDSAEAKVVPGELKKAQEAQQQQKELKS